ncbi:hypothetical protein [Arthrobacter sp. MYb213]|uniref:hypothetical protein n=1 Tax=Arthrobacter sp. MYb213 TaxID=1848595 RepID=UPI000CFD3E1B|nr:hypothetical protein [Arthrobacter sp. MYb213]PRB69492.1 hypothetical protein CQ011_12075 [Arthrobacter sp. MYb213]
MSKVKGRVSVYPVKQLRASEVIDVEWARYPKSDRPRVAAEAVLRVMRRVYKTEKLVADKGNLRDLGEAGRGLLNVDGTDRAYFTAVEIPAPVPATSHLGGGR